MLGQPHIDAVERIGGAGLLRERERRDGGEAGGVGDLELEAAARGRRVRGIGVGQVLDQRLDPRRRRRRVEGDGERAAGAAREAADDAAAEGDVAAGDADLARAGALVADRHRVLRQQARDRQRAAVEVVVGVGEGDVRIDDLRSGVDRVLEKRDRRGEAGQGGNRVRHRLVLRVARGQKPSCELRPPPPRSPHWVVTGNAGVSPFASQADCRRPGRWHRPSAALFEADELRYGLDVACRMLRSTAEFEHETRAASQCRLPMAFIARGHWSARDPEAILRGGGAGRESNTSRATYRCNLHSSPAH